MEPAQPTTVKRATPLEMLATRFSHSSTNASPHQTARRNQMPAATNRPEYASAASSAAASAAAATSPSPATTADTATGRTASGTTTVAVASTAARGSSQRGTGFSQM